MNKQEFIRALAERADLSREQSTQAVEALVDTVVDAPERGDDVRIVNFGSFYMSRRRASVGRNPRTGDIIDIPESRMPKFKPARRLSEPD